MTTPRLSPAMRNMLRGAISGAPQRPHAGTGARHEAATREALVTRGLLDSEGHPTAAGRAVFNPPQLTLREENATC